MKPSLRIFGAFTAIVAAALILGCGYPSQAVTMRTAWSFLTRNRPEERTKEQIYLEYQQWMEQAPQMFISCPYCGGDGRLDISCKSCNGKGSRQIPGVTLFMAITPCGDCGGTGKTKCKICFLGSYRDPDYETKHEEWDKQRRALLKELGYSDEEIDQMDREAAQQYLEWRKEIGEKEDGWDVLSDDPSMCTACFGLGKCRNCGGDQLYTNPFTGEQIVCPICSDGLCYRCGGTGKK